jgi:hypothetical protein
MKKPVIFGIIGVALLVAIILSIPRVEYYEVQVLDSTDHIVNYWTGVKNFKIEGDTCFILKGGEIVYTLKPGEEFNIIEE